MNFFSEPFKVVLFVVGLKAENFKEFVWHFGIYATSLLRVRREDHYQSLSVQCEDVARGQLTQQRLDVKVKHTLLEVTVSDREIVQHINPCAVFRLDTSPRCVLFYLHVCRSRLDVSSCFQSSCRSFIQKWPRVWSAGQSIYSLFNILYHIIVVTLLR